MAAYTRLHSAAVAAPAAPLCLNTHLDITSLGVAFWVRAMGENSVLIGMPTDWKPRSIGVADAVVHANISKNRPGACSKASSCSTCQPVLAETGSGTAAQQKWWLQVLVRFLTDRRLGALLTSDSSYSGITIQQPMVATMNTTSRRPNVADNSCKTC
jgi:hypothetical protein